MAHRSMAARTAAAGMMSGAWWAEGEAGGGHHPACWGKEGV